MKAREIIDALTSWVDWRVHTCLGNYTPEKWWECDLFCLTKNGYFREYEVKISRGDFFADSGKKQVFYPPGWKWRDPEPEPQNKHAILAGRDGRGPSYFNFVVPEKLVAIEEVPEWAGLIEAYNLPGYDDRIFFRPVKKAPQLHKLKREDLAGPLMSNCYYRMHNLRTERQRNG